MEKQKILFTSESVSEGHPDKVCDQIADAILDEALALDPNNRVACEVFCTDNFVLVGGEISNYKGIDVDSIVRNVLKDIGYDKPELGTDYHTVIIDNKIHGQSLDISHAVNQKEIKAGDQGIMFGYATNESKGYMPLAITIAHKLVREATTQRKTGLFKHARADMKSQVTIDYTDPNNIRIDKILMSVQHDPETDLQEFKSYIHENIMKKVAKSFNLNDDFDAIINPSDRFVIGGPAGDTGLTGRKIIVDTYGGSAPHGGGAFSGKDPTKVDRSGAYMARYIAKNLVASGIAERCLIQLSYGIGIAEPLSINVETYGTSKYSREEILNIINKVFDTKVGSIITNFSLNKPTFRYKEVCNYGYFGRPDLDLPWEKLDKVKEIKALLK